MKIVITTRVLLFVLLINEFCKFSQLRIRYQEILRILRKSLQYQMHTKAL